MSLSNALDALEKENYNIQVFKSIKDALKPNKELQVYSCNPNHLQKDKINVLVPEELIKGDTDIEKIITKVISVSGIGIFDYKRKAQEIFEREFIYRGIAEKKCVSILVRRGMISEYILAIASNDGNMNELFNTMVKKLVRSKIDPNVASTVVYCFYKVIKVFLEESQELYNYEKENKDISPIDEKNFVSCISNGLYNDHIISAYGPESISYRGLMDTFGFGLKSSTRIREKCISDGYILIAEKY